MTERTHPPQQDEALRQARLDDDVRAGLHAIAKRLSTVRPDDPMSDGNRTARALTYATERYGFRTPAADELDRALLAAMPRIIGRTTRDAYAIVLRTAAGSPR